MQCGVYTPSANIPAGETQHIINIEQEFLNTNYIVLVTPVANPAYVSVAVNEKTTTSFTIRVNNTYSFNVVASFNWFVLRDA